MSREVKLREEYVNNHWICNEGDFLTLLCDLYSVYEGLRERDPHRHGIRYEVYEHGEKFEIQFFVSRPETKDEHTLRIYRAKEQYATLQEKMVKLREEIKQLEESSNNEI